MAAKSNKNRPPQARNNVDYDDDGGPGEAAASPAAAGSLSASDNRRDERETSPPQLRTARGEQRGERDDGEVRALRQTEPLLKPEMLDRLLQPGPKLTKNVRYVKTEMERYADRLTIERRNAEEAERALNKTNRAHAEEKRYYEELIQTEKENYEKLKVSLKKSKEKNQRLESILDETRNSLNTSNEVEKDLRQQLDKERDLTRSFKKLQKKYVIVKVEREYAKRELAEAQHVIEEADRLKQLNEKLAQQQEELMKIKDPDGEKVMQNILTKMHMEVDIEKRLTVQRLTTLVNSPQKLLPEIQSESKELVNELKTKSNAYNSIKALRYLLKLAKKLHEKDSVAQELSAGRYLELMDEFEGTDIQSQTRVSADKLESELSRAIEKHLGKISHHQLKGYLKRQRKEMEQRNFLPSDIEQYNKEILARWSFELYREAQWLGIDQEFSNRLEEALISFNVSSAEAKQISEQILDFIVGLSDNNSPIIDVLERLHIDDCERFMEVLHSKINSINQEILHPEFCRVNESVIEKDMERRSTLLDALLTGDSSQVRLHIAQYKEVVELSTTANADNLLEEDEVMLPHLIINGLSRTQPNPLKLHFSQTATQQQKSEASDTIQSLLSATCKSDNTFYYDPNKVDAEMILREKSKELSKFYRICAVSLGDYGLNEIDTNKQKNKGEFNRIYSKDGTEKAQGFKETADFTNYYGGIPYYAPLGWRRWAIDLKLDEGKFDEKYGDWPVAYHGTKPSVVNAILEDGFIPSKTGCFLKIGEEHGVYLSPSVNYAALYPLVEHNNDKKILGPRKVGNKWVKMVLQVRVKKDTFTKEAGTLQYTLPGDPQFDSHYNNTELAWLLRTSTSINLIEKETIRVYGIMIRVTDTPVVYPPHINPPPEELSTLVLPYTTHAINVKCTDSACPVCSKH